MIKLICHIKLIVICALALALGACSSDSEEVSQDFNVNFELTSFQIAAGESIVLPFEITQQQDFDVLVNISNPPATGDVEINSDHIIFIASDDLGSHQFDIEFASSSAQQVVSFEYTIIAAGGETTPPPTEPPTTPEQSSHRIFLPSDYITIYEDETVSLDIKRDYEPSDEVLETFHFNTHNVDGELSDDGNQIILTAKTGHKDTFGDIIAVTQVNGVITESKMQVIYFKKNRDLLTPEAPVIALLDQDIEIAPYHSKVKQFDIYDPDSDRIAYRITSSPKEIQTHINKVQAGYHLTLYAIAPINPDDNEVVLEVSDGHLIDTFTFVINESQNTEINENNRPLLWIEENVTLSLIQEINNTQNGLATEFAFVHSDSDGDKVELTVESSADNYEFRIEPPYLYVTADDISILEHEQVTLIADDGQHQSRLTFHLYIKDNFDEFLGGNPNTEPFIEIEPEFTVLETKTIELPFDSYDFEQHDYTTRVEFDESLVNATIENNNLVRVTALSPENATTTDIVIILEDVFESVREHPVTINITKNTPPEISSTTESLNIVEGSETSVEFDIIDPDQSDIVPQFQYDTSLLAASYANNHLTLTTVDINADTNTDVTIIVEDEFGEQDSLTIPVTIRYIDPANQAPTVSFATDNFTLLPGESANTTVLIADVDNDPLTIEHLSSSDNLEYEYEKATGSISLTVKADSPFDNEYLLTFTVTDGIHETEQSIIVTVPTAPEEPILAVSYYSDEVNEETTFLINYSATDLNGGQVTMSTTGASPDLTLNFEENVNGTFLRVTVPDNVIAETDYSFTLVATDDTNLSTTADIAFSVMPVNDWPILDLTNSITIYNAKVLEVPFDVVDPDNIAHTLLFQDQGGKSVAETYPDLVIDVDYDTKIISFNRTEKLPTDKQFNLVIKALENEESYPGSGIYISDDVNLTISAELENEPPVVQAHDLVSVLEQDTYNFPLTVTDPDPDGDTFAVDNIISNGFTDLTVDTVDINGSGITFTIGDITADETGVINLYISDGFETVVHSITVEIKAL